MEFKIIVPFQFKLLINWVNIVMQILNFIIHGLNYF